MSDCLVLGGGFLGSNVADWLATRGHQVAVYSRSFSEWLTCPDRPTRGAMTLHTGEIPLGSGLQDLIDANDIVFYFAGSSTPATAERDSGDSIGRFVVPVAATLDLMRATSTRRVVIASSGGTIYGAPKVLPTGEEHPTAPISVHGQNALAMEQYARVYAERYGLEPVILRYANPYGPAQILHGGQGVIAAWFEALAHGRTIELIGASSTRRDFLFVGDAAEATCAAAFETAGPATYNVGSGESHSLDEMLEKVQRVAGRRVPVEQRPARGVDVPITQLDCSRLRRATGWVPRTALEDGLRATWEWTTARAEPRQDPPGSE